MQLVPRSEGLLQEGPSIMVPSSPNSKRRPQNHTEIQHHGVKGGVPDGQSTHRGVFAKLAEGREGFLMGFSDLFNDGLQLRCQLVALCQLRLWALLLLLVPVISNR